MSSTNTLLERPLGPEMILNITYPILSTVTKLLPIGLCLWEMKCTKTSKNPG